LPLARLDFMNRPEEWASQILASVRKAIYLLLKDL